MLLSLVSTLPAAASSLPAWNGADLEEYPVFAGSTTNIGAIQFAHITVEDGLSQSSISCIYQDKRGFMWFGTADGLNKFDGYHFTIFKHLPSDYTSLSDNKITAIFETARGDLLIGTSRGLNILNRQTQKFTRYLHDSQNAKSLISDNISALLEDQNGYIWVGTNQGVDRLDPTTNEFTHYLHNIKDPASLSNNLVSTLFEDRQGNLWVGTYGGGLNKIDLANDAITRYRNNPNEPGSLINDNVHAIYQDTAGRMWIGTISGLERLNTASGEFQHYRSRPDDPTSLSNNQILAITEDHSGALWLGTSGGGINKFDPQTNQFIAYQNVPTNPDSLSENVVTALAVGQENVLWIGTSQTGINRLDYFNERFSNYRYDPLNTNSISGRIITALYYQANRQLLWIGTVNGLDVLDKRSGQIKHFQYQSSNPYSISSNRISAIAEDRNGDLWIGTSGGGLNHMNSQDGMFSRFAAEPTDAFSLNSTQITAITQDAQGMVWIGTWSGLNKYDPGTEETVFFRNNPVDETSLSNNHIRTLFVDSTDTLWVGTSGGGLNRLNPDGTFTRFQNDPEYSRSLSHDDVNCIHESPEGTFWVGTSGGGLNKMDRQKGVFTSYREHDGLPNDTIYAIEEDQEGNLWLSTNRGISRFAPAAKTFRNFDVQDGLQSNEFSPNAHAQSPTGEIFFGGINGITSFYASTIKDNINIPPVALTSITRNGIEMYPGTASDSIQTLTLKWPDNYFEFEFAALSYIRPERNRYAYMLEGFDKEWNEIGNQRNGRYTNLPGKTYTLRLRAANNDGTWNEAGIAIQIVVVPPAWETWWFRLGAVLLGITSVFVGYRLRVRSIAHRNEELERQVGERTYEVERRAREMEALYQADEKMLSTLALDQVLQTLVDVAVDILGADKSAFSLWDIRQEAWRVRVSRGLSPETIRILRFTNGDGLVGRIPSTGQPVIVKNAGVDPRWKKERPEVIQATFLEGIRSFIHVPIKLGDQVFGIFSIYFRTAHAFDDEEQRLFLAMAQRASLSIENAQLFEQTKELAVMEERSRLARDLHDSAKQKAFAALAQLGAARGNLAQNTANTRKNLVEAENLVYEVIQELTFLIQELYPLALKEKGLATALREYAFEWENRSDIHADLKIEGAAQLPLETEQAVYRIVQECLANVARHSQASQVSIAVHYDSDSLDVVIADNGTGFDMGQKKSGLGLRSMRERVEMVEGTLRLESAPGQGTTVTLHVPYHPTNGKTNQKDGGPHA